MQKIKSWIQTLESSQRFGWLVQFAKFSVVGTINTIIDLGSYYICLNVFMWHYQIANMVGFFTSTVNAYVMSHKFVFNDGRHYSLKEHICTFLKTVAGYGGTCILGIILLWVWVEKVHISEDYAKIVNLFITVPLNYIIIKFWTFSRKQK